MTEFAELRREMVARHIARRGVRDPLVLAAMGRVERERFVDPEWRGEAYWDQPLPIAAGQTISQPYVVALMVEALRLTGGERVLEIGTGSGYAAAVLAEIAAEVFTVERIGELAEGAARALAEAGCENVHVLHDDGSRGWAEEGPFDAILVSAGAPEVPQPLIDQLAEGGRLVLPVGRSEVAQELVRLTRRPGGRIEREDLGGVRFVPLIGAEGWRREAGDGAETGAGETAPAAGADRRRPAEGLPALIARHAEPFDSPESADLSGLMARIGERRVVLLGEATHGSSEFYRFRAALTRRLIGEKGFTILALEADWPDAARIDAHVRELDVPAADWEAFARFPAWMWRNGETHDFVEWLRARNAAVPEAARAGVYGLDLYSLFVSMRAILDYLDGVDPALAAEARARYACLAPWERDPAGYGRAALSGRAQDCAAEVTAMLAALMRRRQEYLGRDGHRFLDAAQNAALVASAERYYRAMYLGARESWNLRDRHMFDTLRAVMAHHGPGSKAVVWAHNSHVGDAAATEMGRRGETTLGALCARGFGAASHRVGFGTDRGTVAAARDWDGPMEVMALNPAHPLSHERQFHLSGLPGLVLPLGADGAPAVAQALAVPRLERAVGVLYRPETERESHYFEAELSRQFDDYVWIDRTGAVRPLPARPAGGLADTWPFGL